MGVARWLELHDVADPARWPRLLRVRQRLQSNPAVQFALAVEDGERPAGSGACRGHVDLQQVIQRYGTATV